MFTFALMNNQFLVDLAKHHKEWIKIVRGFGEYFYTEDIVQEMYINVTATCTKVLFG